MFLGLNRWQAEDRKVRFTLYSNHMWKTKPEKHDTRYISLKFEIKRNKIKGDSIFNYSENRISKMKCKRILQKTAVKFVLVGPGHRTLGSE